MKGEIKKRTQDTSHFYCSKPKKSYKYSFIYSKIVIALAQGICLVNMLFPYFGPNWTES